MVKLLSTVRDILIRPTPSVPRRAFLSGEHSVIVHVLRVRREPGCSLALFYRTPNVRSKKVLVSVMCCSMSDCKSRAPACQSSFV